MRPSQIAFYALHDDLMSVLNDVERQLVVKYVRTGRFTTSHIEAFEAGAEIPGLGTADSESASSCATFLVAEMATSIRVEDLSVALGGRYAVNQRLNPDTITFTPGGVWQKGIVLHGRVATVWDSPSAKRLMRLFKAAVSKHFTRVGAFWVGPQALDCLKRGERLTIAAQSPSEFDLRIAPVT